MCSTACSAACAHFYNLHFKCCSVAVQTCPRPFLHTCMWLPVVRRGLSLAVTSHRRHINSSSKHAMYSQRPSRETTLRRCKSVDPCGSPETTLRRSCRHHDLLPLPIPCITQRAESIPGSIAAVARCLLFIQQHSKVITDLKNVV